ncbi:MAG: hypothetical protein HN742_33625 [Lentisphaerae bacterium]|nr:hypothetical protein [Lentisphaerota bacterium]MBT4820847.1 hypothetical protein [Lentisphaerota bacterium]MBT5611403.1 hypothetical protein [Lentisphaerota bacterium]MBT7059631.1 hypothetical protein [Lentisphaerota bacterium]MBT7846860.1 hypothetical protein [Lentisphaerota bacterium]
MGEGAEAFAGLNKNGLIVFIILLLVCLPLCWLPWVIDSLKAGPPAETGGDVEPESGDDE